MNDRELLELAARAAGMNIQRCRLDDPLHRDFLMNGEGVRNPGQCSFPWNPRDDDGDALRLAVDAGILDGNAFSVWLNYRNGAMAIEGLGAREATRLAFVRVAAEIGKSMGGGE